MCRKRKKPRFRRTEAVYSLWDEPEYVPYRIAIIRSDPTFPSKNFASLGCPVLDHLAADAAGLTGGQVTVVTVGQIDAHFLCSLHLELVHGFLSLGNIDPVIVGIAHLDSLLFVISGKQDTFRFGEHHFLSVVIVLPKWK